MTKLLFEFQQHHTIIYKAILYSIITYIQLIFNCFNNLKALFFTYYMLPHHISIYL